jgi:transcriptional regulator with XRE-family HTH domain
MATVKAWESDRSSPSSHRLSLLAGLLDVSLSWILHGVGIGPNESEIEDEDLSVDAKFDRLKALHAQTSVLIKLLEGDLRNNNLRGSDSRSAFG